MHNNDELAQVWINLYEIIESEGDESTKARELYWSHEKLDDLCWRFPKKAFAIILEILNKTDRDFVLDNLSAGPLESVIARHGNEVIDLVEREAKSNNRFCELIAGVWKNTMSDDIWLRVKKIVSED